MNSHEHPSLRPVLGLVLFLEIVLWLGLTAAWIAAQAAVPSLTLHRTEHWPLLVATGLATLLALSHFHWRHKTMLRFSDAALLESVLPPYGVFRQAWKFLLWRWALAALVVGWLDPKLGSRLEEVESEGIDMMVALDVSNSMMTEDVGMPRLDLASRTVERLMAQTTGDRIGLVVFAGESYVQCPLTTDLAAVKLFLASVSPGMVATQGTAVGSAIRTCWTGFDENSEAARTVVVLTDGENHEDDVVSAASEVAKEGGNVHFLGLATLEGAPIPAFDSGGRPSGFRTDRQGNAVVSKLDEATLLEAAQAGQGTYTRAGKGFVDLTPLLQFKNELTTARVAAVSFVDFDHQLMPFLILAACLLLLETLVPSAVFRRKRLAKAGIMALLAWGMGIQIQAQTAVKEHLVAGSEAFMDGDADAALQAFGEATKDEDMGSVALYNQGCAHMQAEDWASAKTLFDKAATRLKGTGLEEFAHYNACVSALVEGDAAEAVERAKQTLRLNPNNDDARHNLALAQRLQKQQEQEEQEQEEQQEQQEQQEQEGDGENEEGQDGQDEKNPDSNNQEGQNNDGDQENSEESQPQSGPEGDDSQEEPRDGQISRADMERILESLERQEKEVQAKLRLTNAQKGQGKSKTIEKDW